VHPSRSHLSCVSDAARSDIYTLSLHDALPIFMVPDTAAGLEQLGFSGSLLPTAARASDGTPITSSYPELNDPVLMLNVYTGDLRSEEHTSELQSRFDLVCRLLLEKKKINVNHR